MRIPSGPVVARLLGPESLGSKRAGEHSDFTKRRARASHPSNRSLLRGARTGWLRALPPCFISRLVHHMSRSPPVNGSLPYFANLASTQQKIIQAPESTKAFDLDQVWPAATPSRSRMLRRSEGCSAIVPRTDFIEGDELARGVRWRVDWTSDRKGRAGCPDRVRCRFRTAGIPAGASGASIRCPASKGARAGTS